MSVKLQLRRGLASEWISTIVLSAGEPGFETDTGKFKIGDGITQWGTLPYAAPDTPVLNLEDLTDVAVGTPTSGEVLKWNGTAWANLPETGAANIGQLDDVVISSPASGQFLKYSAGAWRNASSADLNTTYTFNATAAVSPDTGANLVLTSSASTTNTVRLVPGNNVSIAQTSGGTVAIAGQNVTATAETFTGVGVTGASVKVLNGGGAFSSINIVGGTNSTVERLNATNIKVNSPNFTLSVESITGVGGATAAKLKITNSITETTVGNANLYAGDGIGISIGTGPTANNVTISNTNGRVGDTTVAGRLAVYDTVGNTVVPTGDAVSWNKNTATFTLAGRLDATTIYGENTQFTDTIVANETYASASIVKGLVFANHYASSNVNGFQFVRSTGTRTAPTAVAANMQIGKLGFTARGIDDTYTLSAMIAARTYGTFASGSIPTALIFNATAQGGTFAPVAQIAESRFQVNEISNLTGTNLTLTTGVGGKVLTDSIEAKTSNGNLTLTGNGTGTVALPAGTTVGGALIGSLLLKGTVADYTALTAVTGMVTGDAYIVLSPTPTHIWTYNGAAWVDLGAFQGAAGANGQGVPTGGTTGQYLRKTSSTDYATSFSTIAYSEVSGTPVLASVATTGAYSSLTGLPIIPEDIADLTDASELLFSGAYADLTGAPTVPADVSDLTDTGNLLFSGAYADLTGAPIVPADISDLTDSTNIIPTDISDLADAGGLLFSGAYADLTGAPAIPAELTDLGITDGTPGQVLTTDGAGGFTFTTVSGGGGGTGLGSRTTANATTGSLANGATGDVSITGFKSYALLKVQTSAAAWVRIYTDATSRSNDSSRSEGTDPTPGAGVIAEVITTGAQTVVITPGVIGFNNDGSPTTTIYAAVTNKSGGTTTITTTLTVLQLEA